MMSEAGGVWSAAAANQLSPRLGPTVLGTVILASMAVTTSLVGAGSLNLAAGIALGVGAIWLALTDFPLFLFLFLLVRPSTDALKSYELGPDLNTPLGALLFVSAAGYVLAGLIDNGLSVFGQASRWALGLSSVIVLGALIAPDATTALPLAARYATLPMLFVAAHSLALDWPEVRPWLLGAVVAGSVPPALVGLAQALGVLPVPPSVAEAGLFDQADRIVGTFPVPTILGTILMISIVLVHACWPYARSHAQRAALLLIAVLLLAVLEINQSRGPLIGLVLALVVASLLRRDFRSLVALVAAGALVTALGSGLVSRFDELGSGDQAGAETDTFAWRVDYWQDNLPRLAQDPVVGVGLGTVESRAPGGNPPHNSLVQAVIETGLVGTGFLVVTVALTTAALFASYRAAAGRERMLAASIIGLWVGYLAVSLSENHLTQSVSSVPIAVLAGLIAAGLQEEDGAGHPVTEAVDKSVIT